MRDSTKALALRISLQATMSQEGADLAKNITRRKAAEIIRFLNKKEGYWLEKTVQVLEPIQNASRQAKPRVANCRLDIIRNGELPSAFVAFMLKAVEINFRLTLYVEMDPSATYQIYSVHAFQFFGQGPCLIKFTRSNLVPALYCRMSDLLYSEKNRDKHGLFGLEEIKP